MDSLTPPARRLRLIGLAVLASMAAAGAAQAHKLKAFATAEGALVSGYAYFTPGGRARQADVVVSGPGGVALLKTGVDDQGNFHFVAKQHIDYTITVDGGDAHVAAYTIHAADLPVSLPAPVDGALLPLDAPAPVAVAPPASATVAAPAPSGACAPALDPAALRAVVRESVAREINPLRAQLDAFQEAVGWRDIVSGFGYIFGLFGVAYGFAMWRRSDRPDASRVERPTLRRSA
jgi:nickel transport protein